MTENAVRAKFYAAVYLFCVKGDEVLLLRRANTGFCDGSFMVPAGHVDSGESALAAVQREAKEELGISISQKDVKHVHTMHRTWPDSRVYFDLYFLVETWDGEPRNAEPSKCDFIKWAPIDGLPDELLEYVKVALVKGLAGISYSEWGW